MRHRSPLLVAVALRAVASLRAAARPLTRGRRLLSGSDDGAPWFSTAQRAALPAIGGDAWARLEVAARATFEWNAKVNVISRKDLDPATLVARHYLPSLALLNVPGFPEAGRVIDVGTGGGFPGLPLAICRPAVDFALCDSRGKKIEVVRACAAAAACENVDAIAGRCPADVDGLYDVVLGRSVANLPLFLETVAPVLARGAAGVLYIKGGEFGDELAAAGVEPSASWSVADLLGGALDTDKVVLHFTAKDVRSVGEAAEANRRRTPARRRRG